MRRPIAARRFFLLASAIFLLGCSLVTGSIPVVMDAAANINPVVFVEPSNTPFLPALYTDTPSPTNSPTDSPIPTMTEVVIPTDTNIPTATQTPSLLPSVTPRTPQYIPPTKKPVKPTVFIPASTRKVEVYVNPTATMTPILMPTETGEPTATLSGSETALPLPSDTPMATATLANTAVPPVGNCATYNFEYESQVASMLNDERAKLGLDALTLNGILTGTARAHSVDMVVNKFMSHTGSDGSTPRQRISLAGFTGSWWGEIIAGGTPSIAVNWWMNEPGHREGIVSTHYTDFGVGYAYCPGQGWFTVDFGGP